MSIIRKHFLMLIKIIRIHTENKFFSLVQIVKEKKAADYSLLIPAIHC